MRLIKHTIILPSGVSIESASYIENSNFLMKTHNNLSLSEHDEEYTPRLFSEDQSLLKMKLQINEKS